MNESHISESIRAALEKQTPEVRKRVLAVADADTGGRHSETAAAFAPPTPKPFPAKRIVTPQVAVKRGAES